MGDSPSPSQLDGFARLLQASLAVRVNKEDLWKAFAEAFPHRAGTPRAERQAFLDALQALAGQGLIRLPARTGTRWDRSMDPPAPMSVEICRAVAPAIAAPWRAFPWHPRLAWVASSPSLTPAYVDFLRRVHDGLVNGAFTEPAPLKYRSLQLTGHEKRLRSLMKTTLFGPDRLTLELLGCLPDTLPLIWESVGPSHRVLIMENAGPFVVARQVLSELPDSPYGLVAYGAGKAILASLGHLQTLGRTVSAIDYVGDLDSDGLRIAAAAQHRASALGLPELQPAHDLHRAMVRSAAAFGHPGGWPCNPWPPLSDGHSPSLCDEASAVVESLRANARRIPEEVLGPSEFRAAMFGLTQRIETDSLRDIAAGQSL